MVREVDASFITISTVLFWGSIHEGRTKGVRAQVFIAVGLLHVSTIPRRVARHILRLVLLLLAAAAEHLIEEAELGLDGAAKGEEEERAELHRAHVDAELE